MTKADQVRLTTWRFKVLRQAEERARNVAWTCRHFGISRKTFYKWKRRFAEHGAAGLGDRARTPHRSPRVTPPDVVSKLLYFRQHYHFGPGKIADYLKRFHGVSLATSSAHRILGKHGLNRLPANQKQRAHATRWKRYEKPQPGHRLQLDVKFLERIPGTRTRLWGRTRGSWVPEHPDHSAIPLRQQFGPSPRVPGGTATISAGVSVICNLLDRPLS